MKNIILIALSFLIIPPLSGQLDLSDIDTVEVTTYWGNITVVGQPQTSNTPSGLNIHHTDGQNQRKSISENRSDFITIVKKNKRLIIAAREPKGFESIDFDLQIPSEKYVSISLIKGGEIDVSECNGGLEINSFNGSVVGTGIGKYAIVNASNGSISIDFRTTDPSFPISLVTMNGEISVSFPEEINRNVRLLSRKNGYVLSDFTLTGSQTIHNLNIAEYSKLPIKYFGKTGQGGSLLFLSTENGPLILKKS